MKFGQKTVALGAEAEKRRSEHGHLGVGLVAAIRIGHGQHHRLVGPEARNLLHQRLERPKGDAWLREQVPEPRVNVLTPRHLVEDCLCFLGSERCCRACRQAVAPHLAPGTRGFLDVVERARVVVGIGKQKPMHVLVDGTIVEPTDQSAALAFGPQVGPETQEANLFLVILVVRIQSVRQPTRGDALTEFEPEVRPLGSNAQHLEQHCLVVGTAHVLDVDAEAGRHAHQVASQARRQGGERFLCRGVVPRDAHLGLAGFDALKLGELPRPLVDALVGDGVGLARGRLDLGQRPNRSLDDPEGGPLDGVVGILAHVVESIGRD